MWLLTPVNQVSLSFEFEMGCLAFLNERVQTNIYIILENKNPYSYFIYFFIYEMLENKTQVFWYAWLWAIDPALIWGGGIYINKSWMLNSLKIKWQVKEYIHTFNILLVSDSFKSLVENVWEKQLKRGKCLLCFRGFTSMLLGLVARQKHAAMSWQPISKCPNITFKMCYLKRFCHLPTVPQADITDISKPRESFFQNLMSHVENLTHGII